MVRDAVPSEPVSSLLFPEIAPNCIFATKMATVRRGKWQKTAIERREFPAITYREFSPGLQGKAAA